MNEEELPSPKNHYLAARLLGGFMMAAVLGLFVLVVLNSWQQSPRAPATTAATTGNGLATGKTPVKYDFYEELQARSKEVQKELDRQREIAANRPALKGRYYRVQVGAFRQSAEAEKMQQQMLLRRLPASIAHSGEFNLVQIGPYATLSEAQKVQQMLAEDGIKTILKTFVDNE